MQKTCCTTEISSGFCSGERAMRCELFGSLGPLLCQFPAQVLTYKVLGEWERRNPTHLSLFQWLIMHLVKQHCLIWFFPSFYSLWHVYELCSGVFSRGNIDPVLQYQMLHLVSFITVWILSSVKSVWFNLFEGLKQLTPVECLALCVYFTAASSFSNFTY